MSVSVGTGQPAQTHFHICEGCSEVWSHPRVKGMTRQQVYDYHLCPKCGAGPYRLSVDTMREALTIKRLLADES